MTGISVVIITRGRADLVRVLLESLVPERAGGRGATEVLVVDDSVPDDARRLQEACAANDARYHRAHSASVSAKRNQGAALARHPVVLFLDSDCRAEPGLLQAHLSRYKDPEVHAVLGLVVFDGPGTGACDAVALTPFSESFAYPLRHETVSWGPSANLSVRATSFAGIGGFDATFPPRPGGEDVDLGLRLTRRFGRIRCAADARVSHARETWNSFRENLRRFYNWGIADRYLVARHADRTFQDLPRLPVLAALVVPAAVLLAWHRANAAWLLLPLVLPGVSALVDGLGDAWRHGPRGVLHRTMAHLYFAANEAGCFVAFVRHGELGIAATRLHFGRNQQYGEWVDSGRRVRATFLAYILLFALIERLT
jgi:glycosyltransferase involved in cell wall biosynthesis